MTHRCDETDDIIKVMPEKVGGKKKKNVTSALLVLLELIKNLLSDKETPLDVHS